MWTYFAMMYLSLSAPLIFAGLILGKKIMKKNEAYGQLPLKCFYVVMVFLAWPMWFVQLFLMLLFPDSVTYTALVIVLFFLEVIIAFMAFSRLFNPPDDDFVVLAITNKVPACTICRAVDDYAKQNGIELDFKYNQKSGGGVVSATLSIGDVRNQGKTAWGKIFSAVADSKEAVTEKIYEQVYHHWMVLPIFKTIAREYVEASHELTDVRAPQVTIHDDSRTRRGKNHKPDHLIKQAIIQGLLVPGPGHEYDVSDGETPDCSFELTKGSSSIQRAVQSGSLVPTENVSPPSSPPGDGSIFFCRNIKPALKYLLNGYTIVHSVS